MDLGIISTEYAPIGNYLCYCVAGPCYMLKRKFYITYIRRVILTQIQGSCDVRGLDFPTESLTFISVASVLRSL